MSAPVRPEGVRFWVAGDVVAWIAANADWSGAGQESPTEAALWWLAVWQAEMLVDTNTRKDWAQMLVDGIPALTLDELSEHLQDSHDHENPNPNPTHAEVDADIERQLEDFWVRSNQ